jgi:hypothetical protein
MILFPHGYSYIAISSHPDHAEFTLYPYNPSPGAVSLPRFFKDNSGYANTPWIINQVNGVSVPMLLDSAGLGGSELTCIDKGFVW